MMSSCVLASSVKTIMHIFTNPSKDQIGTNSYILMNQYLPWVRFCYKFTAGWGIVVHFPNPGRTTGV